MPHSSISIEKIMSSVIDIDRQISKIKDFGNPRAKFCNNAKFGELFEKEILV